MEGREEMGTGAEGGRSGKSGSHLTEAVGSPVREAPGKLSRRSCLSPGSVFRSRDRTGPATERDAHRTDLCADARSHGAPSSGERRRAEHRRGDGSSSDNESDFYEEIEVSCTPESADYPADQGGFELQRAFTWFGGDLAPRLVTHVKDLKGARGSSRNYIYIYIWKNNTNAVLAPSDIVAAELRRSGGSLAVAVANLAKERFRSAWIMSPSHSIAAWVETRACPEDAGLSR